MIETLFAEDVVTVEVMDDLAEGELYPEERPAVQNAHPKRRREYTTGRLCAREALARLGFERFPLLPGPDRMPLWPAGVAGSLSHCRGYCGVAVVRRGSIQGLGLDAEEGTAVEPATARRICSPDELSHAVSQTGLGDGEAAKILFSVKESVYKCVYPLTHLFLGFMDVDVRLDSGTSTFTARFLRAEGAPAGVREISGRFVSDDRLVLAGAMLMEGAPRASTT